MSPSATVLENRLAARARVRHLQVFVKVAELGSVKGAALAVGLTQPTLTHALSDLESLLECPLFLRHARGMRLTAVGMALLPLARRVLAAVAEGAEQVVAISSRATGTVRVAAIAAATAGLLVRAVPEFTQARPEIVVQVQETDALHQAALVARGEVDIAVSRAPGVTPQDWTFTPLMADRFAVICGPHHPLRGKRRVRIDDLRRSLWLPAPSSAARVAFDTLFEGHPPPNTRHVSTRSAAIMWAVLTHEAALTIVPYSYARQFLDARQLFEVSVELQLALDPIGMLLPAAGLGDAARAFAEYLVGYTSKNVRSPPSTTPRR